MAALSEIQEATASNIILKIPLGWRLGALAFPIIVLGLVIVFYSPVFLLLIPFALFLNLRGLGMALSSTIVVIEPINQIVSRSTRFLFIPVESSRLSFGDLENIEAQSYRQWSTGRSFITDYNAFRVNAIGKNGNIITLNWDGSREEMLALAQKISAMTRVPLLDDTDETI